MSRKPRSCLTILATLILLSACSPKNHDELFSIEPGPARESWTGISDKHRCYLKIKREWRPAFQVNCFEIDGVLHTHSNRFVEQNQWLTKTLGRGGAWVYVVAQHPELLVSIEGAVHEMTAEIVQDEALRAQILNQRGYDPIPSAIRVYRLKPR